MTEAQRQDIRDRVAAGEARHQAHHDDSFLDRAGETAIEAKDRFSHFAREHPLTVVAGGLALGVLISGLFPRSPTRRLGHKAAGYAALGAEAAMGLLHEALEAAEHAASEAGRMASGAAVGAGLAASEAGRAASGAAASAGLAASKAGRTGRHRLEDLGDSIADRARKLKRRAAYAAEDAGDDARIARRHTGKRLRRALRRD
jgi:hypothetical protein